MARSPWWDPSLCCTELALRKKDKDGACRAAPLFPGDSTLPHFTCQGHTVRQEMASGALTNSKPRKVALGMHPWVLRPVPVPRVWAVGPWRRSNGCPIFWDLFSSWGLSSSPSRMPHHPHPSGNMLQVICGPRGKVSHILQVRHLSFL